MARLDVAQVRKDFPIFEREMRGRRLAYLDTAASAQKPRAVVETLSHFYAHEYASIHRGVYQLSEESTARYEEAREKVRALLGAAEAREIVFTRNATEAINLVAWSFLRPKLERGDEIVLTEMEHHANIVPWQLVAEGAGARIRVARIDDRGVLDLEHLASLLGPRTKLLAVAHVSNVLGTVNPVADIAALARERGIPLLVDGAQAAPRFAVDVRALGCDFYVFSGHKLYGPSGIGALYARRELLDAMPPYQGGGSMIASVTFEKTTFAEPPQRFEAGTPAIAEAIGLGGAVDYLHGLGLDAVEAHEAELLAYGTEKLLRIPGLRMIGEAPDKIAVLSFVLDGVHPHDLGTICDQHGVAIRAGHHCAQPLMKRFGVPATARASLGLYNDFADLDQLVGALEDAIEVFR